MRQASVGAVLAAVLAGCGGTQVYPDTDVVEPRSCALKLAQGLKTSGGLLQAGTLEYAGPGELVQVYRDYVEQMKALGWVVAANEVLGQKAVGTLRKDNRTCSLEFTTAGDQLRIVIKVSQTQ